MNYLFMNLFILFYFLFIYLFLFIFLSVDIRPRDTGKDEIAVNRYDLYKIYFSIK